jgi:hypothetical protein
VSWNDFFEKAAQPVTYPIGTRIKLLHMGKDPDPVPAGSTGTITGGSAAQIWVKWDNGRTLMLLPDYDTFVVIHDEG